MLEIVWNRVYFSYLEMPCGRRLEVGRNEEEGFAEIEVAWNVGKHPWVGGQYQPWRNCATSWQARDRDTRRVCVCVCVCVMLYPLTHIE